jgi:uncharacterized membrane protein
MPRKVGLESEIAQGALLAALGYLGPLCVVSLLAGRHNSFCRFHGRQGLVLFAAEVAAVVLGTTVFGVIGLLEGFLRSLWFVGPFLYFLVGALAASAYWVVLAAAGIVVSLLGAWKAWQGEYWVLPVLGAYVERLGTPRDQP